MIVGNCYFIVVSKHNYANSELENNIFIHGPILLNTITISAC